MLQYQTIIYANNRKRHLYCSYRMKLHREKINVQKDCNVCITRISSNKISKMKSNYFNDLQQV